MKYLGRDSADQFCKRVREKAGILLLPGSVYAAGSSYFRIGFGRKNMPEVLAALEKFIEQDIL